MNWTAAKSLDLCRHLIYWLNLVESCIFFFLKECIHYEFSNSQVSTLTVGVLTVGMPGFPFWFEDLLRMQSGFEIPIERGNPKRTLDVLNLSCVFICTRHFNIRTL